MRLEEALVRAGGRAVTRLRILVLKTMVTCSPPFQVSLWVMIWWSSATEPATKAMVDQLPDESLAVTSM